MALSTDPLKTKAGVILSALSGGAASATTWKVLRQEVLRRIEAKHYKASNTLTKQQTKYKEYLDKNIYITLTCTFKANFMLTPASYLVWREKSTSTRYN